MQRLNIKTANVADLQKLAGSGGRLRYRNGELYVRPQRSRNLLNRAADSLAGLTGTKRQGVLCALRAICSKHRVDFDEAMRGCGLSDHELRKLESHGGDLKGAQLEKILARFVQIDDAVFMKGQVLGKGAFGEVFEANNGTASIALKAMIAPAGQSPQAKKAWAGAMEAQQREVAVHSFAARARIQENGPSYVVATGALVSGADGTVYQPMAKAVTSGDSPIKQQKKARMVAVLFSNRANENERKALVTQVKRMREDGVALSPRMLEKNGRDPVVTLTVRDWVDGLKQLQISRIAHRDIKPENFLLSREGVWQITDFGTSGADDSRFHAEAGKLNFRVTGNGNDLAKSPEWLASESGNTGGFFEVGHKADVFSLGVAVFRRLSGGRFPFDGSADNPDAILGTSMNVQNVRDFADSGLSFCGWYAQHTGVTIPLPWQPFLDAALHADPDQRLSADGLRKLEIFQNGTLDEAAIRRDMVQQALP